MADTRQDELVTSGNAQVLERGGPPPLIHAVGLCYASAPINAYEQAG